MKMDKFADLEKSITTSKEVFISENYQKALASEEDNVYSVATQLTKNDVVPPSTPPEDDVFTLGGATRESKVKDYAAAESKKWWFSTQILLKK